MAKFPIYEELVKNIAEEALNEFLYDGKSIREWMRIIASEDCISRQAVLEYIEGSEADLGHSSENELVCQYFKELPPVAPKPKTGRWIVDVDRWGDIVTTVNGYRCSECNAFDTDKDNYCPNCGTKMQEVEK